MTNEPLFMAGALTIAGIGSVADIATHRIPNRLTYLGIFVAIGSRLLLEGWHGFTSALVGGLICGGAFLLFFLLHAMGAGDIKLVTAVGCFVGSEAAIEIVLATAIAGGICAIAYALWNGRLRTTAANVKELVHFHAIAGAQVHPTLNLSNPQTVRLPYAIPIAMGVLYSVLAFYCRGGI